MAGPAFRRRIASGLLLLLGLLALYGVGLATRRYVLAAQPSSYIVPFTLESALHFRRVRQIYEGQGLAAVDPQINVPHGVNVRETYSVGSEYVQAALARGFPASMPLWRRLQWIEAGWFCLGIPCLALWVGLRFRSIPAGGLAGLFYAVAISSVLRSTGQELSRENFALPLLLAHLAAAAAAERAPGRAGFWIGAVLSAALLAAALQTWDLVQYYLYLWLAAGWLRFARGDRSPGAPGGALWNLQMLGLAVAGAWNPYLRAHGFLVTPVMALGAGLLAVAGLLGWRERSGKQVGARLRWGAAAAAWLPVALVVMGASTVHESYGHFGELLAAKLAHGNQKPLDPSRLTFHQRIMWVPALHSADLQLTVARFPAILPVSLLMAWLLLGRTRSPERSDPDFDQLVFFSGAALVTFYYFVRFQVFLAIGCAALAGLGVRWAMAARGFRRAGMVAVLGLAWGVELGNVVARPERWGRPNRYLRELEELVDWVRRHAAAEPILANFGTSAAVCAFAGSPILLHPKFEGQAIRDRVRSYGEALYTGTEESFRDWAEREGAAFYIHGVGAFARREVTSQMRYFVDAMTPPADAPARLFESRDAELSDFQLVWKNRKYKVFRVRSPHDAARADNHAARAWEAFQRGDLAAAEEAALRALTPQPTHARALKILRHVDNLRRSGFSYEVP